MKFLVLTILIAIMNAAGFSQARVAQKAQDSASRSSPVQNHEQEKAHEHDREEAHEHSQEEDERSNVGPDKGILEAGQDLGFKLREGVEERFGIKSQKVSSEKSRNFPKDAMVYSKEAYQIFRKRDGFWKPITVKATHRGAVVSVESMELRAGDLIAVDGTGFLKIFELSVFGPAIEGHIH